MHDASTRVLLDRTTIRLDGRPFFAFGPRILLTPREQIPMAAADAADAGFTVVMSPPASPGNLSTLVLLFDECERRGLLVILAVEPRLPDPSEFLAANFKHRPGLHSYCLLTLDDSPESFLHYCSERDRLRSEDVFHPIWTPYRPGFPYGLWIGSVDIHSVAHSTGGPHERRPEENGAAQLNGLFETCAKERIQGRPFFCHSFQVHSPTSAREAGVYDNDRNVARTPADPESWYPWLASLGETPRRDFMMPDADLVRIRTYELLAARVRGIVADFYEFMLGPSPMTGRDRFCELAILAQEIAVFTEFFSEGQFVRARLETGHPVLRAAMLHHSDDILLLLWRASDGDEYWIDPARMTRTEVFIGLETETELTAWRMDFPGGHQIPVARDAKGDLRIQLDTIDLTAKILLTRSSQRPRDIAARLETRMKRATRFKVDGVRYRLEKVRAIEKELEEIGRGVRDSPALREARDLSKEAQRLCDGGEDRDAWIAASQVTQLLRTLVNRQMVRATTVSREGEEGRVLDLLRRSYYTLPEYYRQSVARDEAVVQEYT